MDASLVKQKAVELGFDLVGIATGTLPEHGVAFRQWLADGCHGEMNHLARRADERLDLARVFPGTQSIIVVGMNYYNAGAAGVARYASAPRDYHDVMGAKLKALAEFVGGVWYVDTGPILERDLAQRAGLGWIGKHTNLINRNFGNWILLGEILTTRELAPDAPEREHCGTCRRCLDACPTGALTAPYRLDARRCISCLTIESKGAIPEELRAKIGDRVFGCDACLEACPWNRFAREAATFRPRDWPPLAEFLGWDDARFSEYFRGTPVFRLKRARFLRNVCVALGNRGDASALPVLQRAASGDPEPLVREHAAWAINKLAQQPGRMI